MTQTQVKVMCLFAVRFAVGCVCWALMIGLALASASNPWLLPLYTAAAWGMWNLKADVAEACEVRTNELWAEAMSRGE